MKKLTNYFSPKSIPELKFLLKIIKDLLTAVAFIDSDEQRRVAQRAYIAPDR